MDRRVVWPGFTHSLRPGHGGEQAVFPPVVFAKLDQVPPTAVPFPMGTAIPEQGL